MSVYKKLLEVTNAITPLAKDAKMTSGPAYKYRSIEAVTDLIRPILRDVGLLFFMQVDDVRIEREGDLAWYVCKYTMRFVDPEDETQIELPWAASMYYESPNSKGGITPDDKALGKAHTYALKYFFIDTFLIAGSEDDPDSIPPSQDVPGRSTGSAPRRSTSSSSNGSQKQEVGPLRAFMEERHISSNEGLHLLGIRDWNQIANENPQDVIDRLKQALEKEVSSEPPAADDDNPFRGLGTDSGPRLRDLNAAPA